MIGRDYRRTKVIFAGFHGDEPKGVRIACRLIEALNDADIAALRDRIVIVPTVNPDGLQRRSRRNARKVDINRNFPSENWMHGRMSSRMYGGPAPASEPETRAVIRAIEKFQPALIITIHSISGKRHCNNFDGPGERIARRMQRRNGYPVAATIGYSTPGSFGTWAGVERGIPTITLELPTSRSIRHCWEENRSAILDA